MSVTVVDMSEDVTVIIGNLGRLDSLRPCLQSLFDAAGGIARAWELIEHEPRGGGDRPPHDLVVLRRPKPFKPDLAAFARSRPAA